MNYSALQVGGPGKQILQTAFDARYLKLAADNDPLTGTLDIVLSGGGTIPIRFGTGGNAVYFNYDPVGGGSGGPLFELYRLGDVNPTLSHDWDATTLTLRGQDFALKNSAGTTRTTLANATSGTSIFLDSVRVDTNFSRNPSGAGSPTVAAPVFFYTASTTDAAAVQAQVDVSGGSVTPLAAMNYYAKVNSGYGGTAVYGFVSVAINNGAGASVTAFGGQVKGASSVSNSTMIGLEVSNARTSSNTGCTSVGLKVNNPGLGFATNGKHACDFYGHSWLHDGILAVQSTAGYSTTLPGNRSIANGGAYIQNILEVDGKAWLDGDLAHGGTNLGFYGATAVARAAAYTQTYATATRTHANPTAGTVATTGATQTTPFGYTTAAQADAIPVAINNLVADVANVKQMVNQILDDLQLYGLLQ